MPDNHLEQLVAEWYEFQGYFVRRNVRVGKLAKGGHECELDVVAFDPERHHLVHAEPSMDADSWAIREDRYRKKFAAGRKHIPALFPGLTIPPPEEFEQIVVLVFGSRKNRESIGGGRIVLVGELLSEILLRVGQDDVAQAAIPEHLPILRTLQFVTSYRSHLKAALQQLDA